MSPGPQNSAQHPDRQLAAPTSCTAKEVTICSRAVPATATTARRRRTTQGSKAAPAPCSLHGDAGDDVLVDPRSQRQEPLDGGDGTDNRPMTTCTARTSTPTCRTATSAPLAGSGEPRQPAVDRRPVRLAPPTPSTSLIGDGEGMPSTALLAASNLARGRRRRCAPWRQERSARRRRRHRCRQLLRPAPSAWWSTSRPGPGSAGDAGVILWSASRMFTGSERSSHMLTGNAAANLCGWVQ